MLRNIGAVLVGIVAGSVLNISLILLNSFVCFPMAEGTDMQDPEQMKTYIATLPALGFALVLVAHAGQASLGGWIAARLGASRPMWLAGIVGGLTVMGAAYNQVALSAPAWMWVDIPLIVAATWLAGNAECRRRTAAP